MKKDRNLVLFSRQASEAMCPLLLILMIIIIMVIIMCHHFMQNGLDKNMFVTLKAAISKDFLIVKRDIAGNSLSLCHALLEFIA